MSHSQGLFIPTYTICVKAQSLLQHKQLFSELQEQKHEKPLQLLIDMKVHWGSTLAMLNRADIKQEFINEFVFELRRKETNTEKRRKLGDLALTEEEWDQQKAEEKPHYSVFKPALEAAMANLDEYYQRTAASDAHIIAMVLGPRKKFEHFTRNWDEDLQTDIKDMKVKRTLATTGKQPHQNVDNTNLEEGHNGEVHDAERPWFAEWNRYDKTHEAIPDGMGIVCWWGMNAYRECAFSAAGITTSKHHNRLQGDIVIDKEVGQSADAVLQGDRFS
ncbi:hypothetical protein BYT27DRAFT_7252554 [Phlegmacium glaucopus]|nr:hypothetical protein BYT27DRAFT_7252554 [Phlegmacium glaucopus]